MTSNNLEDKREIGGEGIRAELERKFKSLWFLLIPEIALAFYREPVGCLCAFQVESAIKERLLNACPVTPIQQRVDS